MRFLIFSTLLFVTVLSFFGCRGKGISEANSIAHFTEIIQAYGPSDLSKNGTIFIDLKQSKLKDFSTEIIKRSFEISPKVEGELSAEDEHIIVFKPSNSFKSNQLYTVSLNLSKIADLTGIDEKTFSFTFKIIPQDISFSFQDYVFQNNQWNLITKMNLNDTESLSKIKEGTNIYQNKTKLDYSVEMIDNNHANLIVKNVIYSPKSPSIEFKSEKSIFGLNNDSNFSFQIPDPNKFALVHINQDPSNSAINFIFSQLLSKSQNLNGLITQENSVTSPNYKVDENKLIIYTESSSSNNTFTISKSLKSNSGLTLESDIVHVGGDSDLKPELSNVGIGHIIPGNDKIIFPFEAIGLKSVYVQIFQVYTDNLQEFYQQYSFDYSYNLEFVGEPVHSEKLDLSKLTNDFNPTLRKQYYFNLSDFIRRDKNAIYRINLAFTPQDVYLDCAKEIIYNGEEKDIFSGDYYGIFGYDYSSGEYNYNDREDPCKKAYYNENNFLEKLVLSTNIGLLAKKSTNGELIIVANDIVTSEPISGATIQVFNKAKRELINSKTDSEGLIRFKEMDDAYLVLAKYKNDQNWLKVVDRDALDVSKFDVSGKTKQLGLDGLIYGERNIWRPGDTMHLNFILRDVDSKIPEDHPVSLTLENPKGIRVFEQKTSSHLGPIYTFKIPTTTDYLTGDYFIQVKVGGADFTKSVKIENIKPNKFVIQSELSTVNVNNFRKELLGNGKDFDFSVDWLYGAPAKNKKLDVEFTATNLAFYPQKFNQYIFSDPRNNWYPDEPKIIAATTTNEQGKAKVNVKISPDIKPTARLKLKFKSTAYELSGDFSSDVIVTSFSPYESFTGINLQKDIYGSSRIEKGNKATIELISLSSDEKELPNRNLTVAIYKMENYWWWNSYDDNFDMVNSSVHVSKDKFDIQTNAAGKAKIEPVFNTNGRYYIQVCDEQSGHCTGDYQYVGYVWDDETMTSAQYEEAAQLNFTSEKASYNLKETVELLIPSYFDGKALISLENGDKVVESFWRKVKKGINKISFTPQLEMFPTVYANVTLLQRQDEKSNDIPLRLYGVIPINIQDESLLLKPEIKTKSELKPKESFEITVAETEGKAMYYTLAVVDEGLLNLSRFKTPNPFEHFFAKPALGVRTFDMYNEVMASYGSAISKLFSIGGDQEAIQLNKENKANRFKPVVHHIGPFYLKPGTKNKHQVTLPNYIGAVRIMVVSANENSYGSTEKLVSVKQDLMLLATMPRTLSPGDKLDLPITLFGMKDGLGTINYKVDTKSGMIKFDKQNGTIQMDKADERVERFSGNVTQKEGVEQLKFIATSGQLTTSQEIEIAIKNPNPITRSIEKKLLKPGEALDKLLVPLAPFDSEVVISASSLFPVNIVDQIERLTEYPYGCLEQRLSAATAILYQGDFMELNTTQKNYNQTIVSDLIKDLYKFRQNSGYGLWPGSNYLDEWVTSYVGDFLFQAKEKGYNVSNSILESWTKNQQTLSSNWSTTAKKGSSEYNASIRKQAYRLFTLAQSGKPMLNEMNRLKEDYSLNADNAAMLAGIYSLSGRFDVGKELIKSASNLPTNDDYSNYGSSLRNKAISAMMYHKAGEMNKFSEMILSMDEELNGTNYMSTQTVAFVLRALSLVTKNSPKDKNVNIAIKYGTNTNQTLSSSTGYVSFSSDLNKDNQLNLTNNSNVPLFVEISRSGKEALGNEKQESSNLSIATVYTESEGKILNVGSIALGTDITITTTISRSTIKGGSYKNLALRTVLPSGWEITNNRIFEFGNTENTDLIYQDFKDNQVNSFFELENKNTIVIKIQAKATYPGQFYYPKTLCESMYVGNIFAEIAGFSSNVIK